MSVHLSALIDFVDIFIKYRSKQSTSELSLMVTEMVSTTFFFPIKKLFLWNKNLNKFHRCLFKTYNLHTFKIRYRLLFMLYFELFS